MEKNSQSPCRAYWQEGGKMKNKCKKIFEENNFGGVMKQLKKHPELCETCKIKPCSLAVYVKTIKQKIAEMRGGK